MLELAETVKEVSLSLPLSFSIRGLLWYSFLEAVFIS